MRSVDAAHVSWGTTVKHAKKIGLGAIAVGALFLSQPALADEGGVSFWVPGFFGSLAATPLQPGFSFAASITTHQWTLAVTLSSRGRSRAATLRQNLRALNAKLKADADLGMAIPSYTFAEKVFGGQATLLAIVPFGHNRANVDATLTGNLGLGGPGFAISGGREDQVTGSAFGPVQSALERRRQQLHDLRRNKHSNWRL